MSSRLVASLKGEKSLLSERRESITGVGMAFAALTFAAVALALLLAVTASPAIAQTSGSQKRSQSTGANGDPSAGYPEPGSCLPGLFVRASGTLREISPEKYGYGQYEIIDLRSGCTYALRGEGLEQSVGDFVTIRGSEPQAPGMAYEPGSTPPLLVAVPEEILADNQPSEQSQQPSGNGQYNGGQYGGGNGSIPPASPPKTPAQPQAPVQPQAPDAGTGSTSTPAAEDSKPGNILPDTGGASLFTLALGAVLVVGGVLAHRKLR